MVISLIIIPPGSIVCKIYDLFCMQMTGRRAAWLLSWFDRVLADDRILMRELREALGRMVFVYGALKADKPFLAPLFPPCLAGPNIVSEG